MGERQTVLGWLDQQQRAPQSVDQLVVRVTEARGEDDEPLTHARGEDGVGMNGPETRQRGDDQTPQDRIDQAASSAGVSLRWAQPMSSS